MHVASHDAPMPRSCCNIRCCISGVSPPHAWLPISWLVRVSNVVFMGMGEPLANLPAVLPAVEALTDPMRFVTWQCKWLVGPIAARGLRVWWLVVGR